MFDPKSENFVHTRVWSTFFISDQKSKLTNFSINLIILVVYPVSTDKMSSVVRSVSFGTIKSSEIVWPQIWKFCPYPGMVDFFHFGPKIQTHKFLYKSNNFGCLPSLNWWNVFSSPFCIIWNHKIIGNCLTPNLKILSIPGYGRLFSFRTKNPNSQISL